MSDKRIFLDNNATTPLDPRALEAMMLDLKGGPLNPSSVHSYGREAQNELIKARRKIAKVLGVSAEELIFTSGATESNNAILHGFFKKIFPREVITTKVEHSCIYKNMLKYQQSGGSVTFLDVGKNGAVDPKELEAAISKDTALIVIMTTNNETGVKTDYQRIAQIAIENDIPFVSDGVAHLGKEPFKIIDGIAAMSFSSHKLHGPKGVGLTYINQNYQIDPLIIGGKQEHEMRAGTHNLAGILGFAKAIELTEELLPEQTKHMQKLRDHFEKGLMGELDCVQVNGEGERICNTSNLAFIGIDGESLMMNLDINGIACSHGTACQTGSLTPSRVLSEMGYEKSRVQSSIRFAVSRMTAMKEIDRAIDIIVDIVKKM